MQVWHQARCCSQHGNAQHQLDKFPGKKPCDRTRRIRCTTTVARDTSGKQRSGQHDGQRTIGGRPSSGTTRNPPSYQRNYNTYQCLHSQNTPHGHLGLPFAPRCCLFRRQGLDLRLFVLKFRFRGLMFHVFTSQNSIGIFTKPLIIRRNPFCTGYLRHPSGVFTDNFRWHVSRCQQDCGHTLLRSLKDWQSVLIFSQATSGATIAHNDRRTKQNPLLPIPS